MRFARTKLAGAVGVALAATAFGVYVAQKPAPPVASRMVARRVIAAIEPSRTTGIEPLCVYFDASASSIEGIADPWRQGRFHWSFDDARSGTWATDGASKNEAWGPWAHHCFSAGSHDVTLTLLAPDGKTSNTQQVNVTVTAQDEAYPATATVCVSTSGNFEGCPSGAAQITSVDLDSVFEANTTSSNVRVLHRRGEQWRLPSVLQVPESTSATGVTVGAYGTGRDPIWHSAGTERCANIGASDTRIIGIECKGGVPGGFLVGGNAANVSLIGLTFTGCNTGLVAGDDVTPATGLTFVDSTIGALRAGDGDSYGVYGGFARAGFQGLRIVDTSTGQHAWRSGRAEGVVIAHSSFGKAANGKHHIKLHGFDGRKPTARVLISDNYFA
jgi:hypothetical protein